MAVHTFYDIELSGVENMEVYPFETSFKGERFLVVYQARHFEVNSNVATIIAVLQSTNSEEEFIDTYCGIKKQSYTAEELGAIIRQYVVPIIASSNKHKPEPLLIKLEVIPAHILKKVSGLFRFLFNKTVFYILAVIVALCEILFGIYSPTSPIQVENINIYVILGLIALFAVYSFIHELGHATACRYFRVEHGGVGLGLYLNFPVFYANVSDIWKLPRKKRLVVNIAGVYFQLVFLIPLFALYFVYHWEFLRYFIFCVNIKLIMSLNPFFKYDGYWFVSDLVGVANLRQRSKELFSYLLARLFRKKTPTPYLLSISNNEKYGVLCYTITVNIFFLYYFLYAIPRFLWEFFHTFPTLVRQLAQTLSYNLPVDIIMIRDLLSQSLFLILILFLIYQTIIRPIIKRVKSIHIQIKN